MNPAVLSPACCYVASQARSQPDFLNEFPVSSSALYEYQRLETHLGNLGWPARLNQFSKPSFHQRAARASSNFFRN